MALITLTKNNVGIEANFSSIILFVKRDKSCGNIYEDNYRPRHDARHPWGQFTISFRLPTKSWGVAAKEERKKKQKSWWSWDFRALRVGVPIQGRRSKAHSSRRFLTYFSYSTQSGVILFISDCWTIIFLNVENKEFSVI